MDQTPGKSRADTQPSSVPEVLLQTLLDMDPKLHDVWINLKPLQEALCTNEKNLRFVRHMERHAVRLKDCLVINGERDVWLALTTMPVNHNRWLIVSSQRLPDLPYLAQPAVKRNRTPSRKRLESDDTRSVMTKEVTGTAPDTMFMQLLNKPDQSPFVTTRSNDSRIPEVLNSFVQALSLVLTPSSAYSEAQLKAGATAEYNRKWKLASGLSRLFTDFRNGKRAKPWRSKHFAQKTA